MPILGGESVTFVIDPEIWSLVPGMRLVVVVAEGIGPFSKASELRLEMDSVQTNLRSTWEYPHPQSHPRVAAWRQLYKSLGVSVKKHQSSIEALSRRVLGGRDLAEINPLVDFYNLISLRHLVPAGGWDLDDLESGGLTLRRSQGGEGFTELGSDRRTEIGPGEVSYFDGAEVITRHFVWRQSERAKVRAETQRIFLVSEILGSLEEGAAEAVRSDLVLGLERFFDVGARSAILRAGDESWALS